MPTTESTPTTEIAASLRLSVTRLARLLRQQSDAGLTPTQLAALATIDRSGPLSIGSLAELEQIGAPTATKTVEKLHASGYVDRAASPGDRRVTLVTISPDGRRLLHEIRARKTAWLATRIDALEAADVHALEQALRVLDSLIAPTSSDSPRTEAAP